MPPLSTLQRMALLDKRSDRAVVVEPSQRPEIRDFPEIRSFQSGDQPTETPIAVSLKDNNPSLVLHRQLVSYGNSVRQESFTILGLAGGAGWPNLSRSGRSSVLIKSAWLIGVQMSAGFSMNTVNNFDVAVGIDIGPILNLSNPSNLFLVFSHALGAVPAASTTVSKGGALFFQYPFLPQIGSGNRLAGYVKNDLAAGENIYASVTFYYVQPS